MKKIILILLLFCVNQFAQVIDSSKTKIEYDALSAKAVLLEKNIIELKKLISFQQNKIDALASNLSIIQSNLQRIADSLNITISNVSSTTEKTQQQLGDINQTIMLRTIYWLVVVCIITLFGGVLFLLMRNKLSNSTKKLDLQITQTNESIHNEAIKLDSKLIEILQTQLSIMKKDPSAIGKSLSETDHKLPLKVGEEIHRMRKRLNSMPQEVKGLTALINSLERLEEEFNGSGYEIEELLGKKFIDGMKLEARFVDNPNIPKGEEIITNVLRPQINFNGVLIQVAKVEVGKSY